MLHVVDEIDPLDTQFCGLGVIDAKLVINDESARVLYPLIVDDNLPISSRRSILIFLAPLLILDRNYYIRVLIICLQCNVFCITLFIIVTYLFYYTIL